MPQKQCNEPDCKAIARDNTGKCIAHGGGKRCIEIQEEIFKVLNQEIIDADCKCFTGQSQIFEEALSNIDPKVDIVQKFIDENMCKPTHSNIKKMSEILLNCCDRLFFDVDQDDIIIYNKEALLKYFEELYKFEISYLKNNEHDFLLQIPTILHEVVEHRCIRDIRDIIVKTSDYSYNELIYHVQLGLYDKYIEYFKDLIYSPPPSFTEIAKLIDVCIKFSSDNSIDIDTFFRLYDSFIENGCFGIVCSLQQTDGDYIYSEIDDCIYILETLRIIGKNFKQFWQYDNDIKIKARIMAVEHRISKYNATHPNVNRRIIDYEYILERARIDLKNHNNNYYTILRNKFELDDNNSTHYGLNQSKFESENPESENPESESESESENSELESENPESEL